MDIQLGGHSLGLPCFDLSGGDEDDADRAAEIGELDGAAVLAEHVAVGVGDGDLLDQVQAEGAVRG